MKLVLQLIIIFAFFLENCLQKESKVSIVSSSTYSSKTDSYEGLLSINDGKYTYYLGNVKADTSILYSFVKGEDRLFLDGKSMDFVGSKEYVIEGEKYIVEKHRHFDPDISDSLVTYYFVEGIGLIFIHNEINNEFIHSPRSNQIIKMLKQDNSGFSMISLPPPENSTPASKK